jgi:hypothetical protein
MINDRANMTNFEAITADEILSGERLLTFADVVITTAAIAQFHRSFSCPRCHVIQVPDNDNEAASRILEENDAKKLHSARVIFVYSALLPQVADANGH